MHERSVDSDFLLLELREVLQRNSKIKIILMSATINQVCTLAPASSLVFHYIQADLVLPARIGNFLILLFRRALHRDTRTNVPCYRLLP